MWTEKGAGFNVTQYLTWKIHVCVLHKGRVATGVCIMLIFLQFLKFYNELSQGKEQADPLSFIKMCSQKIILYNLCWWKILWRHWLYTICNICVHCFTKLIVMYIPSGPYTSNIGKIDIRVMSINVYGC